MKPKTTCPVLKIRLRMTDDICLDACVTFGVYAVPPHLIRLVRLSRSLSRHDAARTVMTSHEY